MKDILKSIEKKVDKVEERLGSIDVTLVKQEENLKEHMRRTELLENQHQLFQDQLEPIKSHVDQIKGAGRLIAILGAAATVVGALVQFVI